MTHMTSAEIRQSFLDFFKSKEHTIVPSSSLMPDSPNLLFTNAGMNQFVPIFLGQRTPDVSRWAGAIPGRDTRAADTQKCIRAGGKHNDLEDVGLDTYHHTFFEMLGNWSFGDYFKREAIEWAWELLTEVWRFPKDRLYATVFEPGKGDPGQFDHEAHDYWARIFSSAGLDPKIHVRTGGKKDNFWMMGDTGPCGPCSEIHIDLTPSGDTRGSLVNQGTPECIEIWNLVFIQFNAAPDGSLSPLPAKHVDTGMGFERVAGIIQCTANFTDFSRTVSNYETDVFRPLFERLEKISGMRYGSSLPKRGCPPGNDRERIDVAFRVIADHIRTLAFAIADGILPGNTDRNYVLRRILRRAVRYGRSLGCHEPFFYKLVDVLADTMGDVFPEIRAKKDHVREVVRIEEEAFNKTLDRGIELFTQQAEEILKQHPDKSGVKPVIPGELAFKLYDTYGFPLDLTELMARERDLAVDLDGFNRLMDEQRERARKSRKKEVIELSQIDTATTTKFVGYDLLETQARVLDVVSVKGKTAVILDITSCYAEMGGQVGDTGELAHGSQLWRIVNTQKVGDAWLHFIEQPEGSKEPAEAPVEGSEVTITVDVPRRRAIQRHHTVTHLLHWALREVVSPDVAQKGSFVGPDKLTFDFNSPPLTPAQVAEIERLVNERVVENAPVFWTEVKYDHVSHRRDIRQIFGEKYGEWVRVVQIGGTPAGLDGYSMELCGGTHCRAVGEIGLFSIVGENAIAAGVRRIEAVAGLAAYQRARQTIETLETVALKVNAPIPELEKRIENLLEQQRAIEKQLRGLAQKQAVETARALVGKSSVINGVPAIIANMGNADADTLQGVANELKGLFKGVVLLGGVANGAVALVAAVSPEFTAKVHAGKLIQQIAPIVGGRGGGKPDNARGGGKDVARLDAALDKARSLLG